MCGTFRSRTTYLLIIGQLLISLEEETEAKNHKLEYNKYPFKPPEIQIIKILIFYIFRKKCCKRKKLRREIPGVLYNHVTGY
jgi:hypothetical protein